MEINEIHSLFLGCSSACTDTRKIEGGEMFFALKGPSFNGNEFAQKAIESGAKYAIIDDVQYKQGNEYILVQNVLETLQNLANYHRKQFTVPVLGITGSNGKTTTKELIHSVLSEKMNTLATEGNFNNHIGLPLTLLRLSQEHQFAVIEMGANHVGEIAGLCAIAEPDYGIITNIGKAHIGEFGSYDNIRIGKTELYRHIEKSEGHLFVNGNDALLMKEAGTINATLYGDGDFEANGSLVKGSVLLNVEIKKPSIGLVQSGLFGDYNFPNLMAAVAIGGYFGLSNEEIKRGIEKYIPNNNRSQILKTDRNTLILDAYNANPSSMIVALENFKSMKGEKKFFILGDMLELGQETEKEHQKIIEWTSANNLQGIFVGDIFCQSARAKVSFLNTNELINDGCLNDLNEHTILIKGSRGVKLEELKNLL